MACMNGYERAFHFQVDSTPFPSCPLSLLSRTKDTRDKQEITKKPAREFPSLKPLHKMHGSLACCMAAIVLSW